MLRAKEMESQDRLQRRPKANQMLLILASLIVVVAGLKAAQSFFLPVLLAFFIATVSFPITNWLRNHRVPRAIAVLLTVLVDFAFLIGVVILGLSILSDLQEKWNLEYSALTITKLEDAVDAAAAAEDWMQNWWGESRGETMGNEEAGLAVPPPRATVVPESELEMATLSEPRLTRAMEMMLGQVRDLRFSQVWTLGTDVVSRVVTFLGTSFVVIIMTVFMLTEARMFARRMDAICAARGPNLQRMLSALRDTQRYLGIKTGVSLATGLLSGILCWAAGLDFYPLWGILAFALNYIPVVGSVIASLPPAILAMLVKGPPEAIAVIGGYFLINTFLGNIIEPMVMGRRFGLSTLVVLLSVLFWGWLWGPIGMLLAVPLTMMVKVVLDNSDEFRWVAVAIGKETHRPQEEKRIITEGAADRATEKEAPASDGVSVIGRS